MTNVKEAVGRALILQGDRSRAGWAQTEDHVRTQQEGNRLKAPERGLEDTKPGT